MRRSRRYWLSLIWGLWIVFLVVATSTACVGHPAAHDVAHPPWCFDSSSPVARGDDKPILFAEGGTFPLRPEFASLAVPPPAIGTYLCLGLSLLPHQLSQTQESTPLTIPQSFLPVLRL